MRSRFRQVVALGLCSLVLLPGTTSAGPFGIPNLGKIGIPNVPNIPKNIAGIPNIPNLGKLQRYANGSQFLQRYVVPNLVNNQGVPISNIARNYATRPAVDPTARSVRNYASTATPGTAAPGTAANPIIPQLPANPAANTATVAPATNPGGNPTIPQLPVEPSANTANTANTTASVNPPANSNVPPPDPMAPKTPDIEDVESAVEFASRGESEFRNGNYKTAARLFRHALLDSPQNGMLMLLLAQAQFAQGQHVESAMTTYDAIDLLPEEHWGVVVSNYQTLYGNPAQYSEQLRALEKRVKERPDDPVVRFLAGYHYGYIGYPKNAVLELDRVLPVLPDDQLSARLRNLMAAKAGVATVEKPGEKVVSTPEK